MNRERYINKITYKSGKEKGQLKLPYKAIVNELIRKSKLDGKVIRIHPCQWFKSKGHFNLSDDTMKYIDVCMAYGLPYTEGNDAPRGGQQGYYIDIRVDRRNKFWKETI